MWQCRSRLLVQTEQKNCINIVPLYLKISQGLCRVAIFASFTALGLERPVGVSVLITRDEKTLHRGQLLEKQILYGDSNDGPGQAGPASLAYFLDTSDQSWKPECLIQPGQELSTAVACLSSLTELP